MPNNPAPDRRQLIAFLEGQAAILGRYTDIRRIGRMAGAGRFSLVFTAFDDVTRNTVVLKFHNPLEADEYRTRSFEQEASVLQQCRGKANVLQLVDEPRSFAGKPQAPGGPSLTRPLRFMALELARCSVHDHIYKENPSPLSCLMQFRDICRGVQTLHRNGIYHQDLKPENCLIMSDGTVVVSDFGAAKTGDPATQPKRPPSTGLFHPGDRTYRAFEQSCGLKLYALGDMYSLGAVLFEMFTKSVLNNLFFGHTDFIGLMSTFRKIPQERRQVAYDRAIGPIATRHTLPALTHCDTDGFIPPVILPNLDRLYRALAALDYRRRTIQFASVFHELDRMILTLHRRSAA
jgi:serine/threonine protein kinase